MENQDIAPGLLEKIQSDFQRFFEANRNIAGLYEKVRDGTATYAQVHEFAILTGQELATAFRLNLSSAVLPEGRLYYNIAKRIIEPTLKNNYELVCDVAAEVQSRMNEAAGIGIRSIKPELNTDRIDGIVNKVSAAEQFDDVAWVLDEPIVNFTQSVVDDSVKANADFQYQAGLSPKIVRRTAGNCCEWCARIAGTYEYKNVNNTGNDVFRRHSHCRCKVEFIPGTSKKVQDVRSKEWHLDAEHDKIEQRKQIGVERLTDADKVSLNQYKSFESYLLNEALREEYELSTDQKIIMSRLDQALEKLPAYSGVTYRSLDSARIRDVEAFWEKYQVGNIVSERAYTSTSTEVYDETFDIQMIIEGKSGRDLRGYTSFENEVLYPRGTEYVVAKREGNTLWLREK